jgi:FtsP/CotA-like multicopper oxidase with cupredoxin domain
MVLSVTEGRGAPDGFERPMLLVNGLFPGPEVHANAGDLLVLTIRNNMQHGELSIHLHGISQAGTPFYDGAMGFNQDPILPGQSFKLRVQVGKNDAGTYYYHAHHNLMDQSIFGALIIHGRNEKNLIGYDEERILILSDWWHESGDVQTEGTMKNDDSC